MWNSLSNIGYYENLLKEQTIIHGNDINFEKMCRTCLRDANDSNNLFKDFEIGAMTIHNEDGNVIKLVDMLTATTNILIDKETDNFPQQLCNNCIQNVSGAYFYKIQSQKAENTLRKMLSKTIEYLDDNAYIEENATYDIVDDIPIAISDQDDCTVSEKVVEPFTRNGDEEVIDKNVLLYDVEYEETEYNNDNENIENLHTENMDIEEILVDSASTDETNIKNNQSSDVDDSKPQPTNTRDCIKNLNSPKKASIQCPHCKIEFPTNRGRNAHLKSEHPAVKSFECSFCSQTFVMFETLKRHEKIHQEHQRNKTCKYCDKCFVRADDLKRHIRTHTNERPYTCETCNKSYKQSSELKDHQLIHIQTRKLYKCSLCSKTLRSRNGMYMHQKAHTDAGKHQCRQCKEKFVTIGELTLHRRQAHIDKTGFACSYCKTIFKTYRALNMHCTRSHKNQSKRMKLIENEIEPDVNDENDENVRIFNVIAIDCTLLRNNANIINDADDCLNL